jgi:hypothetical protein
LDHREVGRKLSHKVVACALTGLRLERLSDCLRRSTMIGDREELGNRRRSGNLGHFFFFDAGKAVSSRIRMEWNGFVIHGARDVSVMC